MQKLNKVMIALLALIMPCLLQATSYVTKEEMITNLNVIKQVFQANYAPSDWKKACYQWAIDSEIARAVSLIEKHPNMSLKEYQKLLSSVINSTRDYHMKIVFLSTEAAYLPIRVKGVNNKYFITAVDRTVLSKALYPIEEGDELLSFGGRPTGDVVKELMSMGSNSNEETDRCLAEFDLTTRNASSGFDVPKGTVNVRIKSRNTHKINNYSLKWDYHPEKIKCGAKVKSKCGLNLLNPEKLEVDREFPFAKNYSCDWVKRENQKKFEESSLSFELGDKYGYLPNLGEVIWKAELLSHFRAYIYLNADNRPVGYIRIPSYHDRSVESDILFDEFCQLITFLEQNTEALVIDQVNNPGGSYFYALSLLSCMTNRPLDILKEKMKITQFDVHSALGDLEVLEEIQSDEDAVEILGSDYIAGYRLDSDFIKGVKEFAYFIVNQWEQGKRLTDPVFHLGVSKVKPHPTSRYTKPILMLVNGMSFSCGDIVPAVLQDNHRATIFGTRTSGAGGAVARHLYKNQFGVGFMTYTYTIAIRNDSSYLENIGVVPDVGCKLTERDITENFADYRQSINDTIDRMLAK